MPFFTTSPTRRIAPIIDETFRAVPVRSSAAAAPASPSGAAASTASERDQERSWKSSTATSAASGEQDAALQRIGLRGALGLRQRHAYVLQAVGLAQLGGHFAEEGCRELVRDDLRRQPLPSGLQRLHAQVDLRRAAFVAVEAI